METFVVSKAGVDETPSVQMLGHERLLSLADVCDMTGWCPATASNYLEEYGRKLKLHSRIFILESSLFACLHKLEEADLGA